MPGTSSLPVLEWVRITGVGDAVGAAGVAGGTVGTAEGVGAGVVVSVGGSVPVSGSGVTAPSLPEPSPLSVGGIAPDSGVEDGSALAVGAAVAVEDGVGVGVASSQRPLSWRWMPASSASRKSG